MLADVIAGIVLVGERQSLANLPRVQVLTIHGACCDRAAVAVVAIWYAAHMPTGYVHSQSVPRNNAAVIRAAFGVVATLIGFRRVDTKQTDRRVADDEAVTINDTRGTADGLRGRLRAHRRTEKM